MDNMRLNPSSSSSSRWEQNQSHTPQSHTPQPSHHGELPLISTSIRVISKYHPDIRPPWIFKVTSNVQYKSSPEIRQPDQRESIAHHYFISHFTLTKESSEQSLQSCLKFCTSSSVSRRKETSQTTRLHHMNVKPTRFGLRWQSGERTPVLAGNGRSVHTHPTLYYQHASLSLDADGSVDLQDAIQT